MTINFGTDPATLEPPGLARLRKCPECNGVPPGGDCYSCDDSGYQLWYACVRCGSTDWCYVDGCSEDLGMKCWTCGTTWRTEDPAWQAQRFPDWIEDRARANTILRRARLAG